MSTVRASSRTGWCSFATLDSGVLCPVATVNMFVEGWSVGMNGLPSSPAWEVHAVSCAAEGIEPSRTPFFSCSSVRCKGGAVIVAVQAPIWGPLGAGLGLVPVFTGLQRCALLAAFS